MAQATTRTVKIKSILGSHCFTRGTKDYLAGKGFDKDYDQWDGNDQWCYERGRLFAAATGGSVPVKGGQGNKRVTYQAVNTFVALRKANAIL